MSDVPRLLDWFATGLLLRPDPAKPGTVHLARALAALCGVPLTLDPPERQIAAAIGDAEHYVFVLADGLGLDLVDVLPPGSFLRRHVALALASTFPSSTAPALTSIATGLWPAQHGVPAWLVYLRERGLHTVTLPFTERFSGRPLGEFGLEAGELFTCTPLWAALTSDTMLFLHQRIAGSAYTRYASGGRPILPYTNLDGAIEAICSRVRSAVAPTFTYLYYSAVDTAVHAHGPGSRQVAAEVVELDQRLDHLSQGLPENARLVVSADHGGYDVSPRQKLLLQPDDELSSLLLTPPAGEPPTPLFHVRPGLEADFAAAFRRTAGDSFVLLTPDEVEGLRLLGPDRLSPTTRARIGDFLALSAAGESVIYSPDTAIVNMKGFHGGLSPAEVLIPLILA
jgi:hypothetical protein